MLQTICVTGIGESFSNCSSTIANVSLKSLRGKCATRRKTCSEGSQATLSLRWKRERQLLATRCLGNASPGVLVCWRLKENPSFCALNCQSCRASAMTCSTLQAWTFCSVFAGRAASEGTGASAALVCGEADFALKDLNRKKAANARHSGAPMMTG